MQKHDRNEDASCHRQGFIAGRRQDLTADAVERAIAGLVAAFETARGTSGFDRASVLERVAAALREDAEALAAAAASETGYLTLRDMRLEVQRAIEVFVAAAACVRSGLSRSIDLDVVERGRGAFGIITREPIGPILGITAFNGPLLIAAHKIAPAIAVGAPIVIKPSPRAPQSAMRLAELVVRAGWAAEAIAVLDVDNEATKALVVDQRLPVVSFTGGEIGWSFKAMAPRKRFHLELGGVGAVYVAADANLPRAAKECAEGGFVRSGQSCISVQRIYVASQVYEEFKALLVENVLALTGERAISPLVDVAAAERVEAMIRQATDKGARVACGAVWSGDYVAPTVLHDATPDMTVMRREIFGPVVAICAVNSAEEAVREINAVSGAIHHGIYTAQIDRAMQMAKSLRAGGVIVNGPPTWRVDHAPYGGTGDAGFGREGVSHAIDEFTEPKVVVIRPSHL